MKNFVKIFFFCLFLISCGEETSEPEMTQDLSLKKSSFSDLQGWKQDDVDMAIKAYKKSCKKIAEKKNQYIDAVAAIKIPSKSYLELCQKVQKVRPEKYKQFIEENFVPYLVEYQGESLGKFTSYYEAELQASYHKSERYKYPVYGRPFDLVELNLQDFDKNLPNKRLVGRIKGNKFVPYYSRAEIHDKPLNAPIILWGDNAVDIYVMQIQGSAVAQMEDGSKVRIGYIDNNGKPFKGIGSILLKENLIQPGQASMGKIKKWLKENPEKAIAPMNKNERYVFHRLVNSDGPIGAQGVSLTAGRSLAVDRKFIPLGALLWLETTGPDKENIHKLVVAQDVGGAIKGAIRGDYFWGSGGDEILDKAGRMHSQGKYYILLPKNIEENQYGKQSR